MQVYINPHAVVVGNGIVFTYKDSEEPRMGTVERVNERTDTVTILDQSREGNYRQFKRRLMRGCQLWQH